jgi:hypothetical protein
MLNFIIWDDLVDYKFMEIPSTDIELRLLNNEGKSENIKLNGNSIANLDTISVEKGKIDLTKFKVKAKDSFFHLDQPLRG